MLQYIMKYFLLLFIFCQTIFLNAQEINVLESKVNYIGKAMSVYNDKSHNHSIEYIKTHTALFKPLNKEIDNRFFTQDTIWYHFKVTNPKQEKLERYFVLDIPWFDHIEIYINDNKTETYYQGGNQLVFSKRSYSTNLINIKHSFEQGASNIYIKAKTNDPFIFALSILDYKNLIQQSSNKHTISFCIYSITLTMMLFNFILYFIIRHRSYLYYSLFLLSFIFMNMSYNNYTFEYFLGDNPILQNWIEGLFLYIFSIMGLFFTQSFLEFKQNHPKLYITNYILIASFILLAAISAIFAYTIFVAIAILSTFIFGFYALCVALYSKRKNNRSAIFFIWGVSFGLIGTMITGLSVSAIIPVFNVHLYKAVDYGIVIDTILLSIALAKRYTLLFENLKTTQNELIQISNNLESLVEQRTEVLNQELENNKLLLKEVFHRVKNNLQIISSLLLLQTNNIKNPQMLKIILEENIQRIQSISTLHEKIFLSKNLKEISLKHYFKEIIFDFIDVTGFNTLDFKLNIQHIPININHLIAFGLIINELLTNSFKYAFKDNNVSPKIIIDLHTDNDTVILSYKDNGQGINLEQFSKGFGFSLLESLCVHQLGGSVSFFNDKGFNYTIGFPKDTLR